MRLPKAKVAAVGAAVAGVVGVVAALLQWWPIAAAVIIALQTAAVVVLVTRRVPTDIAKTRRAVFRIERRLQTSSARDTAVEEDIRADIADGLAELTELAKSWGVDASRHA